MSKIQEALAKIQASKPDLKRVTMRATSDDSDAVIVAKLIENDTGVAESSVASDRDAARFLAIDRAALMHAGLLAPNYHEQLLADQYRDIKRPLIAHAFGKSATLTENGSLIMVTSALAGEGKTFTSINLALSMAREKDHSVILVDADVAKPHLSDIFGASYQKGLLDVLDDSSLSLAELILPTDIEGLSFLPAGNTRDHSTELLASARMGKIATALRNTAPGVLVVMDTPPLLQTSEAKVLASIAGQIVMIVRAESTAQSVVLNAIELFSEGKSVNLILNQVRNAKVEYQYGYGYGKKRTLGAGIGNSHSEMSE